MGTIFILKILYGAIGFGCGLLILRYRRIVYEWTGRFYWAEKYIGSGGTIVVITLFGMGVMFLSVAYVFWGFDPSQRMQNPWQTQIVQPVNTIDTNTNQ